MARKKEVIFDNIRLSKFVHGGQVLAEAEDGRKLFVWGGLPDELVDVRIIKKKHSYLEGVVSEVHERSPDRIDPVEPNSYLSTSPWQIVNHDAESRYKDEILQETFERESIDVGWGAFKTFGSMSHYRNKMEYGFWGDDDGLHLAHFVRGTHGKQIVEPYSLLPKDSVSAGVDSVLQGLRKLHVRAGNLKTVVARASEDGAHAAALFVKSKDIDLSALKDHVQNLDIYYSDPRSPASVPTEKLYSFGDTTLTDALLGIDISYNVLSFFQVNLPIFETVLSRINETLGSVPKVDMYSGVGAIGIPLTGTEVLVESDEQNIIMAKRNVGQQGIQVVHATSETALDHITSERALIVDPPRAGLHKRVIRRILDEMPPQIVYLSCNPVTQARDVALLQNLYRIHLAEGYNFFPRTPHVESLIVLQLVK